MDWLLAPLASALLLSGLDDLVVDGFWFFFWMKGKLRPSARMFPPGERQLAAARQQRIAIVLPLWKEHEVIGRMLEHNFAAIRYGDYHVFAGCYPNDPETQDAIRAVARRFPNVHLALCPHDGPTSKADCLNWIFQRLLLSEDRDGIRFDVIVMHDAEDLIHPDELRWINYYSARFDYIQTPVLPLPTPLWSLTHGVYCDEFAESHTRDMTVRPLTGGFVPSAGVGTGFRREALEKLARESDNRIFEPEALTEDYVNGLRMYRLGCKQAFVPLLHSGLGARDMVATREYFPKHWGSALRQRTRWVTGIALQGWERFGWRGRPAELYWLWRDRKGLIGNPLSFLANLVFVYGLATGMWVRATPLVQRLAIATFALQLVRTVIRMACCKRVYGWVFALGAPVRMVYGNALNAAATFQAVRRYVTARARGEPLKWLKTEHAYPNRAALLAHKRMLGEILAGSGRLSSAALASALETLPAGVRLGQHLVNLGLVDQEVLYQFLSFQQGLPLANVDAPSIAFEIARALPEQIVRTWKVLPFKVADGSLFVASPEIPGLETSRALRGFTALDVRFHLITPDSFEALAEALL